LDTTAIAPRENWLSRATFAVVRALRLSNEIEPTEDTYSPGADYATGGPNAGGYSLRKAWYAYGINPWVQICVERIAEDIASLPLLAAVPGADGHKLIDSHPVLDLFANPNSDTSGRLFRMQNAADLVLAANAPILPLKSSRGAGIVSLRRLHPARISAVPGGTGLLGWQYDRGGERPDQYKPEAVVMIRGISWEDDPRGLMGTTPIQALAADLDADLALAKMTATSAKKGRPDAIYHPKNADTRWAAPIVRVIKAALDKVMQDSHGGIAVLDGAGELEILGWSPRDMEGQEARSWTRQTVLSRFGVPPTVAGIPDAANYATAQMEQVTYWTRIKARCALIEDGYSKIAEMAGYPGVRIVHDFSQVQALQDAQGAALTRVAQWAGMGADPRAAANYEGFGDQPDDLWPMPVVGDDEDTTDDPTVETATPVVVEADRGALEEARDEIAAAAEILNDGDADADAVADALGSLDAANLAVSAALAALDAG